MGINEIPAYTLERRNVDITASDSRGYDAIATALYQFDQQRHVLKIVNGIIIPKSVFFQEVTHIIDVEDHARHNQIRYITLSGYTEYHASQVELMCLIGAKTINDTVSFSVDDRINTFLGTMSIREYLRRTYKVASDLFMRPDFPVDSQALSSAVGTLYNYFGLRSICEMYSTDYEEELTYDAFLYVLESTAFTAVNKLMHGWINKSQIEICMVTYYSLIAPLMGILK